MTSDADHPRYLSHLRFFLEPDEVTGEDAIRFLDQHREAIERHTQARPERFRWLGFLPIGALNLFDTLRERASREPARVLEDLNAFLEQLVNEQIDEGYGQPPDDSVVVAPEIQEVVLRVFGYLGEVIISLRHDGRLDVRGVELLGEEPLGESEAEHVAGIGPCRIRRLGNRPRGVYVDAGPLLSRLMDLRLPLAFRPRHRGSDVRDGGSREVIIMAIRVALPTRPVPTAIGLRNGIL